MDGGVRKKVDEYQDFLLRRYGLQKLAERDRNQAGLFLQAQLDANSPQSGEATSGEMLKPDFWHDLDILRFDFTLVAPTVLKNDSSRLPDLPICGGRYEDWDIGKGLPFPPELVEGITGRDLEFLERAFGLSGAECYTAWADVYREINRQFEKRREHAGYIVDWLKRNLPSQVPVAPVFLLSAWAYQIDQDTPSSIKEIRSIKGRTIPELEERAGKFFKALEVFEEAIQAKDDTKDPYPLEDNIGRWTKRIRLGVTLSELLSRNSGKRFKERVEEALRRGELKIGLTDELRLSHILALLKLGVEIELEACKGIPELWKDKVYAPNAPGDLVEGHRPTVLYQIFNAVAKLIADHWRKRGAQSEASLVFSLWKVEIGLEAARQQRRREKA